MRMLLASANVDLRLSLELLLSEQPDVEIVGSASESGGLLALIQTSKPEMVVTDWDLPGRPLVSILDERDQLYPHTAIVVLTNSNRDRQLALEAGTDAAILKGSSPDLLLSAFRKLRRQKNDTQEM